MPLPIAIRPATVEDSPLVWKLYQRCCAAQTPEDPGPMWTIDVYPAQSDLDEAIDQNRLFVAYPLEPVQQPLSLDYSPSISEQSPPPRSLYPLVGAFTLSFGDDSDYQKVNWQFTASVEETSVIHLLAVDPDYRGQGVASQLLTAAFEIAHSQGAKVMHLDITKVNIPARNLYERFGFHFAGEHTLFYEDTGEMEFLMFEKPL